MNPIATISFENNAKVIIELFPELAPNTVNSFIYLAGQGVFDNHRIARVEPGYVVDVSTNAFGSETCRYLIENEAGKLEREFRLRPELGVIAMGGYAGDIAGGEFFFPLARHEKIDGNYPCFGKIIEGLDEIIRIGNFPVREFQYNHNPQNIMHKPLRDATITTVRVDTHGISYPEPLRLKGIELPRHWFIEDYENII